MPLPLAEYARNPERASVHANPRAMLTIYSTVMSLLYARFAGPRRG